MLGGAKLESRPVDLGRHPCPGMWVSKRLLGTLLLAGCLNEVLQLSLQGPLRPDVPSKGVPANQQQKKIHQALQGARKRNQNWS